MKITDAVCAAEEAREAYFSFEYFAPSTAAGVNKLLSRIHRMAALAPSFVSMSHAGGLSEFRRNVDVMSEAQRVSGVTALLHLSTRHMGSEEVAQALQYAKQNGICNVLAMSVVDCTDDADSDGGSPHKAAGGVGAATPAGAGGGAGVGSGAGAGGGESTNSGAATPIRRREASCSDITTTKELVALIRRLHGDYFCIAITGQPERSRRGSAVVGGEGLHSDVSHLREKMKAGADIIISEFFFEIDSFLQWHAGVRDAGITIPIVPSIMPIQSYASFTSLTRHCRTRVPARVTTSIAPIMDDVARVRDYGVQLAISTAKQLIDADVLGFNFVTLNLEVSTKRVLVGLDAVNEGGHGARRKYPWRASTAAGREREGVRPIFWANRPGSYINRTASWSEFPNARWEDKKQKWGGSLGEAAAAKEISRSGTCDECRAMWGENPLSVQDVYEVFAGYIEGSVPSLPWCETELALETKTIIDRLARLNRGGFLTINSQPRVNGLPSDHPVFGWGGSGGYVYQKAYVEFFTSPANLARLMKAVEKYPLVTFTAVDVRGNTYSNCTSRGVQAVTWGVFPGKEVLQPTVVDHESFLVWKDEAFGLWKTRWASLYPEDSDGYNTIHDVHDEFFLVNLVDNDFIGGDLFGVVDMALDAAGGAFERDGGATAAVSGSTFTS